MKYTTEQIEAVRSKMKDLPPIEKKKQELGKSDVVKMLAKEIAVLRKRGYTFEQISEYLKGEGLDIGTPSLKSYLQRAKQASASKPKVQASKDTPPAPPQAPQTSKTSDTPKGSFSPRPDSDDI
jgi:hypothetical protein